MDFSNSQRWSGSYVDGVYVGNNGTISGLNCPKGTKLFDSTMKPAIFFLPDDLQEGEDFKLIDPNNPITKDVLPCYAVSNYGRVLNIATGQILKPSENKGYKNYTLSADNENGNRKIQAHRLVLGTFRPIEGMEKLQVNHINMVKSDNYIDKPDENGKLIDNLEWCTAKENVVHKIINTYPISREEADQIREYRKQGCSLEYIRATYFPNVKYNTIKYVCENKFYYDPNYDPTIIGAGHIRLPKNKPFSDEVVLHIRKLSAEGVMNTEIKDKYYPHIPLGTISDIIRRKVHNNI